MMKTYIIKHIYDVDGGFGDAVTKESIVGIVNCTAEEIKEFLDKYSKPLPYDEPYSILVCHALVAEEIDIVPLSEIEKDPYGDNGLYERFAMGFQERSPESFKRCQDAINEWL